MKKYNAITIATDSNALLKNRIAIFR